MSPDTLLTFLASNLLWQTALIGGAVFMALTLLPRAHASTRYRIALSGLLGCLLLLALPFVPTFLPDVSVGVVPETVFPLNQMRPTSISVSDSAPTLPQMSAEIFRWAIPSLSEALTLFWVLGGAVFGLRIGLALWQSRLWVKQAKPVHISTAKPLSRRVEILRSSHASAPLVLGFFRPVILVPENFNLDIDVPEIRVVLEHEIAHITRKDVWTHLAQKIVLALLWWCLPLHWIHSQIGIEREKLCDDIAAQKTGTGKALARALVDLAGAHLRPPSPILAIGIHPRANQLAERVHRLYKGTPMTKISKKLLLTTSLAVPLTLAGLSLVTPRAFAHDPVSTHRQAQDLTQQEYALYKSAERNDLASVKKSLERGVNPNIVLGGDGTPLIAAVRHANEDMINALIDAGADPDLLSGGDGTPLITAAASGRNRIVSLLLKRGADVNHPTFGNGDGNPLIQAASHGHLSTAKLLLANGADVNASVPGDETPLINAAQQGHLMMAKLLVSKGADVHLGAWAAHYDGTVSEWRTPYGEATKHGRTLVVQYLDSQGASEKDGLPPKTEAASSPMPSHKIVEGRVSSRFGIVRKNILPKVPHRGIDIVNKTGTPIYAPADGLVVLAASTYRGTKKYGNVLVLETSGGVETVFAHLQGFALKKGDVVKPGDVLAYVGNTGASTGPHVHIETIVNGKLLNPSDVWPQLK
ncbi:MAG: hypothetical protein COA69_10295 [Robiginitomaculum sp.]|nr:MAG: hypothetical protein COA69_10295 [Robiginitomaculum sp.]